MSSKNACVFSILAAGWPDMDASFAFLRLGGKIAEINQIAQYRSRQTTDVMEECLVAWRDGQARNFALAIEEPQRSGFEPLRVALAAMEDCLKALESRSSRVERDVAKILADHHQVHRNCQACENKVNQIHYYVAAARNRASQAKSTADSLCAQIDELGAPPV